MSEQRFLKRWARVVPVVNGAARERQLMDTNSNAEESEALSRMNPTSAYYAGRVIAGLQTTANRRLLPGGLSPTSKRQIEDMLWWQAKQNEKGE